SRGQIAGDELALVGYGDRAAVTVAVVAVKAPVLDLVEVVDRVGVGGDHSGQIGPEPELRCLLRGATAKPPPRDGSHGRRWLSSGDVHRVELNRAGVVRPVRFRRARHEIGVAVDTGPEGRADDPTLSQGKRALDRLLGTRPDGRLLIAVTPCGQEGVERFE